MRFLSSVRVCVLGLALAVPGIGLGQEPEAKGVDPNIGQQAPALKVTTWATDKQLTAADLSGKPYVLEFWATWCPPCRASIPHLNRLSQRIEPFGIRVVGLSDETIDKVKPFAGKMDMSYYVGVKAKDMGNLVSDGIPFAAVVGTDGVIVWAGHPMDPAMEATVFEVTKAYRPELAAAIAAAQAGDMKKVLDGLQAAGGEVGEAGVAVMLGNMNARLANAETKTGLEQYMALTQLLDLYKGFPGTAPVTEKLALLEADPETGKLVAEQKVLMAFQKELEALQAKAQAIEAADDSQEAAMTFYLGSLVPVFEAFVDANPDHPATKEIANAIPQIQQELARLKAAATIDEKPADKEDQ